MALIYFLKNKIEALKYFKEFKASVKNQVNSTVRFLEVTMPWHLLTDFEKQKRQRYSIRF